MFEDLRGRVALVTGGATGIGGAISAAFGEAGMKVAVHFHAGADQATGIAEEIERPGGTALLLQRDITESEAPGDLVRRTVDAFGRLDVLVNNAGGMVARRPLETIDDAFFDAVVDLNVRQLVHACRASAAAMKDSGGSIINVSSISARTGGSPGSSIYSGAKAFVSTFTRSLARELAPHNIRVNALSPGTIATAFHERHSTPEKLEATRKSIPMLRLGAAADCAGTALFLASNALSSYVTGQVIEVNGGQFMG
ncbi:SDR family NAD(P)-dependent oxidoreductase [Dongia deserti]|uniref:SDR family NAD(P)-dependent oxidoreductase n=1 Tax=Dongia deserti TaxID=2268030 RepID=UPI000E64F472|nr:SDR family oxidoreductase [Dongia deserti]